MNNAIQANYFWKGVALLPREVQLTMSTQYLREKIIDLYRNGAQIRPLLPCSKFEIVSRVEYWESVNGSESLNIVLKSGNVVRIDSYNRGDIA